MANRKFTIISGAVVAVVGALVALCGAALAIVLGSDSSITTGQQDVSTATTALVTPLDNVDGIDDVASLLGQPRLRLSVHTGGAPVFIGVGRARDVDAYLARADIDHVDDIDGDPFHLDVSHRPGGTVPVPPGSESFWVARASGTDPSLDWRVRNGNYRVVLMSAAGHAGVGVQARATVEIPHLYPFAVGALIAGGVAVALGGMLVVIGLRRTREVPSPDLFQQPVGVEPR
jgi:hypothetical protein